MPLKLMYITNRPVVADIAQEAGVDRIWVDMEYIGKEARQAGMNTVKSHHTIEDVIALRPLVSKSGLMVRVNPIHEATRNWCDSREEIENTVRAGADSIMLPMFKTAEEVERFVEYVDGRAVVQILLETKEACDSLDRILDVQGIDEVHIGLNDLHLAYGMRFMFQLLSDGTVGRLCARIREKGLPYGFGGIARLGYGLLPAEYIIAEHYRLGSSAAILSRSFCDANGLEDPETVRLLFREEVANIRNYERKLGSFSESDFENNRERVCDLVDKIVNNG